ncbi:carbon-nitrogen hydrolase family protein [Consotaella salsifontis]|uniref:Predicted amidohydrolase n=1 Tax=Consotaella salsifontis TaxID=1365950 RepID=A0A1T4QLS4_9HYPH|nr:carbon-nitrogen hydrolase family protein [Consotaella salsifontis]SKA04587.1 Predicted amidohydrolase [Consotaella salsifontis]
MTVFSAAVLQMRSGEEPRDNAALLERLVEEAVRRGAIYLQTPEMTGMLARDREVFNARLRDPDEDEVVKAARDLARRHRVHIHIGSVAVKGTGDKAANRAFVFSPTGELLATYDKIHMFDVDLDHGESWRESATYQPGETAGLVDLALGEGTARLGLGICYDVRFPQLFQRQALAGAEVLTAPAAFTRQTGEAHWHVLQRARAIENGAFVVSAAQGGRHQDGRETYGHSLIVDPWGRVLAEMAGDEPGVAVAEIDTAMVASARKKIPNLANARAFGLGFSGGKDRL